MPRLKRRPSTGIASGLAGAADSASGAFDGIDGSRCTQGGDDVRQMFDVLDLDIDQHVKEIDLPVDDLEVRDIAAVLGDQRRKITERAG